MDYCSNKEDPSGSKKNFQKKNNKGEMSKCAYFSKGYHPKRSCMKKKIDMLTQLLEKKNISLPDCSKKREGGSNSENKEIVHALVASTSSSASLINDSGTSRHMVLTRDTLSSLDNSKGPNFFWEMTLLLIVWGRVGLILTMVPSMMCCMSQV